MKIKTDTLIIGAGVGGLGAGCWLKHNDCDFIIAEANSEIPMNLHNGVHYLHSKPDLPFFTGIKKITLTDGILRKDGIISSTATLNDALEYSEKVREIQHPSSIMEVGKSTEAFIPPYNSMNELINDMRIFIGDDKFSLGKKLEEIDTENHIAKFKGGLEISYHNIISTIPLDKLAPAYEFMENVELNYNPIYITNYQVEKIVPNWMINLYVPEIGSPIYRASILNGICSVESIRPLSAVERGIIVPEMLKMFHFSHPINAIDASWPTGKVVSISRDDREMVVDGLRTKAIFSIGRFGLWNRKLLIDSTINQAASVVSYLRGVNRTKADWDECKEILIK